MTVAIPINDPSVLAKIADALADPPRAEYYEAYQDIANYLEQEGYTSDNELQSEFINDLLPCGYFNYSAATGRDAGTGGEE